ncbi:MAG: tRNA pseudouridine(55) synthase TruB [Anaerolineae bacterium]|nr:tRNA pseudouridine(55) synthase TruB [Anaerolineae bacterium]
MESHRPTSGILIIDKPKGITSHDVVARVRKVTGVRKVGHTGTLDPLATGVLVVCVGQATRLIEYLTTGLKRYRATIRFGLTTDTLDAEGQVLSRNDVSDLTQHTLQHLLPTFLGEIEQIPPIFSAIKRNGQPLYKAARAGKSVKIEPRLVTIYALEWIDWSSPDLILDVSCSSGTYIRALARDLGEAAGPGAFLADLTRTANHHWLLDDAVSLNTLERAIEAEPLGWQTYLFPPDRAVDHLPKLTLDDLAATRVKHGNTIRVANEQIEFDDTQADPNSTLIRAYLPDNRFLAIMELVEADENIWQPKKVFQT